jgi:hypothetical protein
MHVVAAIVLLSASASATGTGVLSGKVYNALTREPIIGATVVVMSSGARGSTDRSGRFALDSVPESSVIVASAKGFFDERESMEVGTTGTGFYLMDALGTRPDRYALEPSETLVVHGRLDDRTLHADTVPWFLNPGDADAQARSNSTKLALVEHCMGGGIKIAYTNVSAAPHARHMWLATGLGYLGPGMSYLREKVVVPIIERTDAMRGSDDFYDETPTTGGCAEGAEYNRSGLYRVASISVGYIDTTQFGGLEFVECAATGPSDKWLVLKLKLHGGGTVFF